METVSKVGKGKVVLTALLSGLVLGVLARAWMRWISTDPEFSWSGTVFIVMAFMIFTLVQSLVFLLRKRFKGKRSALLIRTVGVIFSLPLFTAAGAIMFPTVALASIALWQSKMDRKVRFALVVISLIIPAIQIRDFGSDFGWNFPTLGKSLLFILIYSVVILFLKPTLTPYVGPDSRMVPTSRFKSLFIIAFIVLMALLYLLFTIGITGS